MTAIEQAALVDALAQTSFAVMAVLTRLSADNDLSLTQFRVLAILRDRRLRMAALADHLGLERSTMSGLVDRAARRGLIDRTPSTRDGRSIEVSLSPAGADLAEQVGTEVRRALAPMIAQLDPASQSRLRSLLEQLVSR